MKEITTGELRKWMSQGSDFELVDVREDYEHEAFNIGGRWIPLSAIVQQGTALPADKPVVLYCRKGVRSAIAIQRLEAKFGFQNLWNLTGGLEAW